MTAPSRATPNPAPRPVVVAPPLGWALLVSPAGIVTYVGISAQGFRAWWGGT